MYNWRKKRVQLVHPDDSDRRYLEQQLRGLNTDVSPTWPMPEAADGSAAALIVRVTAESADQAVPLFDSFAGICVAVVEPSHSSVIKALVGSNLHGLVVRPHVPGAFGAHLAVAAAIYQYSTKLQTRISRLEENLRSRRTIEKAIRHLGECYGMNEEDAYEALRNTAMKKQMNVSLLAETILARSTSEWQAAFSKSTVPRRDLLDF